MNCGSYGRAWIARSRASSAEGSVETRLRFEREISRRDDVTVSCQEWKTLRNVRSPWPVFVILLTER